MVCVQIKCYDINMALKYFFTIILLTTLFSPVRAQTLQVEPHIKEYQAKSKVQDKLGELKANKKNLNYLKEMDQNVEDLLKQTKKEYNLYKAHNISPNRKEDLLENKKEKISELLAIDNSIDAKIIKVEAKIASNKIFIEESL
jgi:hypothetical protein